MITIKLVMMKRLKKVIRMNESLNFKAESD